MSEPISPWPTLREFLDAGGDLESLLRAQGTWDGFVEELDSIQMHLPEHRAEHGRRWREIWEGEMVMSSGHVHRGSDQPFEWRRQRSWECDLWENPDLLDRILAALSPAGAEHVRRSLDGFRELRLRIVLMQDNHDHPYWNCATCTRPFPPTVPAIVTGEEQETNCRDCVAAALERYDRGEIDQPLRA